MSAMDQDMIRLVNEQRLGFVATVGEDGSPNLSPKGTMVVVDDDHIAFGEIRSPNTLTNLRASPVMEINFVDPLARKGYRFKGSAEVFEAGTEAFDQLLPRFERWGELSKRIRAIVRLRVERALPLTSPAYDLGVSEAALRAEWREHYLALGSAGQHESPGRD